QPIDVARFPGRRALNGEQAPQMILRFRSRETGEERWSTVQATPIRDAQGNVRFAVNIFRDITQSRHDEEALRASEERFRSLIEKSSDAIALLNAHGTVLYAGPSTERVLGYTPERYIGRNAFDLVHPDDRGPATTILTEVTREPGGSGMIVC